MKRKVLLIGWDSADWKIIDNLMAKGLMPAFKRVVDNGVRARFATLDPPLSPMLWTSMATGKRPFKHGVFGFVESDGSGGVRPISSYGRKTEAFWNMFTKEGIKTNVVAWWPSNPVENINGVMVSNLYHQEKQKGKNVNIDNWDIPEGSVFPEKQIEKIKDLRIHPSEIFGNLILPFVPSAKNLDEKYSKRLQFITKFLAHSGTVHATCTELMQTTDWDITAVYHDALDHFSHGFMKYNPPRREMIPEEEYEIFKDVVQGAYIYHDMMLERLLEMIDDQTTVIICSDHGFHSDHLRPESIPKTPAGPAVEHSPYGIFVAMGPDIKKGETIYGAKVLDLTPTLLSLFDLPIGRDMDGRPLIEIFVNPKEIKYVDSWDEDSRFGGELVISDPGASGGDNEAALQQLIDLGYIDDINDKGEEEGAEKLKQKLKETLQENSYYLAKSYMGGKKYDEALEVLLEIEDRNKPQERYLSEIIRAAINTRRFALADEYIQFVRSKKICHPAQLNVLQSNVLIGENKYEQALLLLEQTVKEFPDYQEAAADLGRLFVIFNQLDKAKIEYQKLIDFDPLNHIAYQGYGLAALRNEEYEVALEYLLKSIEIIYHNPRAHMLLGETLALMKEYELAIASFEVVRKISPRNPKAFMWLYDLYSLVGDEDSSNKYLDVVKKLIKGEKIILTGLPSIKLRDTILELKKNGYSVHGNEKDLLKLDQEVSRKGWLSEIDDEIVYLPIKAIPSLTANFIYRILFVTEDSDESMLYLNETLKLKGKSYNKDFLENIISQEKNARVWFDQQPLLDIKYLKDIEELDSDIVKQFLKISS